MVEPRHFPRSIEPRVDFSRPRRVHVIGVGGPGMSALAIALAESGHRVSGSDVRDSGVLHTLRDVGVDVKIGHHRNHVEDVEVVTYSTAIPHDNIEMMAAQSSGVTLLHRGDVLGSLVVNHRGVGVAGTHGKTTTSALLLSMLRGAGMDPSFVIGAEVRDVGRGAGIGTSDLFVVELDESDGTAEVVPVESIIVTNIDVDHLDYFGSADNLDVAFRQLMMGASSQCVVCIDDPRAARAAAYVKHNMSSTGAVLRTYGFHEDADVRVTDFVETSGGSEFTVTVDNDKQQVSLPLRGVHNALNCTAAIAMAHQYGVALDDAALSIQGFGGVERRFEERGVVGGALLIDDYAHLPAEIEAVIGAACAHPQRRGKVIAVFQPNRFHRIAQMAHEYAHCFQDAQVVVITDIYASGTKPIDGVTGQLVADAIVAAHPEAVVEWAPKRSDVIAAVLGHLKEGDVCISMGCGDIGQLPSELEASYTQ
jgi:UDP-N-acetylmuramate--alanine ligase